MKMIINCSKEKTMQMLECEIKKTIPVKENNIDRTISIFREVRTSHIVFRLWKELKSNISREPLIDGVINDDSFRIYTLNLLSFVDNSMRRCQRWLLCGTIYEKCGKTILQGKIKRKDRSKLWDCILVIYPALLIAICPDHIIALCMIGSLEAYEILSIILMKKCVEQMIIKDINHIFADFGTTVSRK